MDFRIQRTSWSPSLHLNLVIACLFRKSYERVALNPVTTPAIDRIYLQKQIRSAVQMLMLGDELKIEWEAEVAN